jgi:twitching motility two-component system response regulator PilH
MPKSILIVEDSPMEMKLLLGLLEDKGFQLYSATDGDQAVAAAQLHHPDLILLDVVLPKKNGYQVCRQLKNSPDTASSKIVMVSSKSLEMDRYWGLKQGADDYLTKPIDPAAVMAAIERAI